MNYSAGPLFPQLHLNSMLEFTGGVRIGASAVVITGGPQEYVGLGIVDPQSRLDVAGGIRAAMGQGTSDASDEGYSFNADGNTGMVCFFFSWSLVALDSLSHLFL